ncbi:hypothetical protein JCM19368_29530 [Halomonas shantousis]
MPVFDNGRKTKAGGSVTLSIPSMQRCMLGTDYRCPTDLVLLAEVQHALERLERPQSQRIVDEDLAFALA